MEKVAIGEFVPDPGIELWWKDRTRRPNQRQRKEYSKKCKDAETSDSESDTDNELDDILGSWDKWMDSSVSD